MYKGLIYCTISPSGKKYYGFTIDSLENRKKRHYSNVRKGTKTIFYDAIRTYNFNFEWKIVEEFEFNNKKDLKNKLCEREKYWIEKDKTYLKEYGYNMTMGGDGGDTLSNHPRNKEISEKISESHKGEKNYFFGKKHSKETKELISTKLIGKFKGEKNPMYNRKIYDIWIEKYGKQEADKRENNRRNKLRNYKPKRIICEFCNKEIAINIYKQFHGIKCKQRSNT